jgi:ribosomal protein S18 acetylase RimI-like enzyme
VRRSVRSSLTGVELTIRTALDEDRQELRELFALIVEEGGGFPQAPPVSEADFERVWVTGKAAVIVARAGGRLAGAYYLVPNFAGRAAHIANAGYMVHPELRRKGIGRELVDHSFGEARRLGFDALMFNLVFESNPARRLYERLGFEAIGRVPEAVDGESAVIYWRKL